MTKDTETGHVWIKSDYEEMRISFESIMYIQAKSSYTLIHTYHEKIVSNTPLKQLLYQLPSCLFYHSHSNYVVAVSQVKALELTSITLFNNENIPMVKKARPALIELLKELGSIESEF